MKLVSTLKRKQSHFPRDLEFGFSNEFDEPLLPVDICSIFAYDSLSISG